MIIITILTIAILIGFLSPKSNKFKGAMLVILVLCSFFTVGTSSLLNAYDVDNSKISRVHPDSLKYASVIDGLI